MRRHSGKLGTLTLAILALALSGCGGSGDATDLFAREEGDAVDSGTGDPGEGEEQPDGSGGEDDPDGGPADEPDANNDPPLACPPPVDASKAALCLVLDPEEISFVAGDDKLDGEGMLIVQIFDKARPGAGPALDERLSPPQPQGGPIATKPLAELTEAPMRFEGLPTTVYPRAIFVDDVEGASPDALLPGTWLGGIDVSEGLSEDMPLQKVVLEAGKGTVLKMRLTALRKLTVKVSRTAPPAGNAQGPLTVFALGTQAIDGNPKAFGLGEHPCANVVGSNTATVTGIVVGKGPYWVTGILDDLKGPKVPGTEIPAGALVSADMKSWYPVEIEVPAANQLSYPPDAYEVSTSIALNQMIPSQGGPDTVSCP